MKLIAKVLSMIFIESCLLTSCNSTAVNEKNVIEGSSLSPAMTIETMTEAAKTIVHGIVVEQGEAYVHTEETEDAEITVSMIVTPMTIEVIDCLKGDVETGETIVYIQRGGETDTTIQTVDDECAVSVGKEILIFLNEGNATWGAGQGVRKIQNGNTTIENRMLPAALYSENSENAYSEISLDDLKSLVLEYVNE